MERGGPQLKYKHWSVAPPCPEGQQILEAAGLPPLLAGLLAARGITEPEEARRRLSPESEPIPDPLLMKDMDRAVRRDSWRYDGGMTIY